MKINIKNDKKKKGMTLIEITLVIAILLGLISSVFIGIQAYKRGSDRAECILLLSTVHKIAFSEALLVGLKPGDALLEAFLVDNGYLAGMPDCPDGEGSYTFKTEAVEIHVPYVTCSLSAGGKDHVYLN